ncbi:MAG: protein phosphatase 2C domain-containing protein [Gammaproteobacteria bacterium]|jgi:PPM family protein phosphatase|nr:protein phosphatase 2C domain-containing protein [Gammaproteobacteria bacterium]
MLKISSLSDTGLVRSTNEDFYLFSREHRIIIVADGVGGYDYGEVASRLAAESAYALLDNEFDEDYQIETDEPIKLLNEAVVFANKKVIDMKVQRPSHQRMGTTLTCLYLDKDFVYFSYIGDSRVYHIDLDDQTISQLTTDHTLSKNKLDSKKFPNLHARANDVLTRMIGAGNNINPGFGKRSLKQRDIILACTDGLSDLISDEQILECVLQNKADMNSCLKLLLEEVKQEGARDNITVVMASSD